MICGLVLFTAASLWCARSRTVEWLVALRLVQAPGGCAARMVCMVAMAMVHDFFPVRETAKIISLLILIPVVSPLPAPTVDGWVAVRLGWSPGASQMSVCGDRVGRTARAAWGRRQGQRLPRG